MKTGAEISTSESCSQPLFSECVRLFCVIYKYVWLIYIYIFDCLSFRVPLHSEEWVNLIKNARTGKNSSFQTWPIPFNHNSTERSTDPTECLWNCAVNMGYFWIEKISLGLSWQGTKHQSLVCFGKARHRLHRLRWRISSPRLQQRKHSQTDTWSSHLVKLSWNVSNGRRLILEI